MMLPTHALGGMALALPVAFVAPELAPVVLLAGLLGGVFPDLDMYVGHRKTLHFPTYYSVLAAVAVVGALLVPGAETAAVAVFLLAAAVHSVADVFGGGLELRPWEGTSERAVYDHHRKRWLAPRRWVGYDGSPGDFLLSVALAVPLLLTVDGVFRWLVVAAVATAAVYAAVRRALPTVAEWLLGGVLQQLLPGRVLRFVPDRYHGDDAIAAASSTSDRRDSRRTGSS